MASNELKMIKTKSGFEHKMTTPGTPQSNGLAERIGGIIAEKARTMLIDARLPPSFAGEAFRTATYLYNLTPPKLDGKKQALSPSERFYQRKFPVHHLRVFGCKAWIRPPRIDPGKVQPRAHPGVLVGYDQEKRAYRVYVPHLRQVIVSRDVTFDEANRGYFCKATGFKGHMSMFDDEQESNCSDEEGGCILPPPCTEEEELHHEKPFQRARTTNRRLWRTGLKRRKKTVAKTKPHSCLAGLDAQ